VKLSAALPPGEANGAPSIGPGLVTDPHRMRVMIAIVDCRKVVTDADTGEDTAVARVRRIEAVLPADLGAAERLLRRALERRTGQTVLPLELEEELTAAFDAIGLDDDEEKTGDDDGDD